MKPFGFEVTELERNSTSAWIGADGTTHKGPTVVFEAKDPKLWMKFMVQGDEDSWFTTVRMALCKPGSNALLRVMHKTDVYSSSEKVRGKIYHPLGVVYFDDDGRLRRERLLAKRDYSKDRVGRLLEELVGCGVELAAYEDVTMKRNPSLQGKLCSVIEHDALQKTVHGFLAEKVMPVSGRL